MPHNQVVSREDWLAVRRWHLEREEELQRLADAVAAERRALPWMKVDKVYVFDTRRGPRTLADLFDGRSQLIVQHLIFAPDRERCVGGPFSADCLDAAIRHLAGHDVTAVAVSRAALADIEAYKRRMGWRFDWVASQVIDFERDFTAFLTPPQNNRRHGFETVGEIPGCSVFYRNGSGDVFHTYSSCGGEELVGARILLDLTPRGCGEKERDGNPTGWVEGQCQPAMRSPAAPEWPAQR